MKKQPLWLVVVTAMIMLGVTAGAVDKPATGKPKDKDALMAGTWKITCVGKKGNYGQKAEDLSQSFLLTFSEKPAKGKAIEGKPFGFEISSSKLGGATPGGSVSFTTNYKRGSSPFSIDWKGKLIEDGTKITDGKFSLMIGSGTFTAEKQTGDAK